MPTYQVKTIIDNQPTFEVPLSAILSKLKHGGALKVLSAVECHTDRQRKWYHGICLRGLSEWNGETPDEWDFRLKTLCGGGLLKTETWHDPDIGKASRLTTKGVGKRNFTQFIENILSLAITEDWLVTSPDKELRAK